MTREEDSRTLNLVLVQHYECIELETLLLGETEESQLFPPAGYPDINDPLWNKMIVA